MLGDEEIDTGELVTSTPGAPGGNGRRNLHDDVPGPLRIRALYFPVASVTGGDLLDAVADDRGVLGEGHDRAGDGSGSRAALLLPDAAVGGERHAEREVVQHALAHVDLLPLTRTAELLAGEPPTPTRESFRRRRRHSPRKQTSACEHCPALAHDADETRGSRREHPASAASVAGRASLTDRLEGGVRGPLAGNGSSVNLEGEPVFRGECTPVFMLRFG